MFGNCVPQSSQSASRIAKKDVRRLVVRPVCEPVGVWREVLAGLVACDLHVESCGGAVALKVGGAVENGLHEGFVLGEVGGGAGSGGG